MAYKVRQLIARAIETNNPNLITSFNGNVIIEEMPRECYDFVKQYIDTHEEVPTKEYFESEFPLLSGWLDVKTSLNERELITKVFQDEKDSALRHYGSQISTGTLDQQQRALEQLKFLSKQELVKSVFVQATDVNNDQLMTDFVYYETGLAFLDEIVGGFESGTINVFAAPTGTGKTMFSTLIATLALATGHRVLYIPTETGQIKTKIRISQYLQKVNFADIRRDKDKRQDFVSVMNGQKEFNNLYFTTKNYPYVHEIVSAYKEVQPDIVILEGIYDIPSESAIDDIQQQLRVMNELRDFTTANNAIIFATTQTTKTTLTNKKDIELGDVGGSVKVTQHPDTVFALQKSGINDDIVMMKPLKVRIRNSKRQNFYIKYDFSTFDVEEWEDLGGSLKYKVI